MNRTKNALIVTLILSASGSLGVALAANPVTNAEELVAEHLNSIASPALRAGIKTRVVQGSVEYKILGGSAGVAQGKAFVVSDGKKLLFMMKLPSNDYRGEQFVFDGDKDKVAFSTSRQSRSSLGAFVFVQDAVIREGLLGGVLSTAWPLCNLNERKAKLNFSGLKKVDGQELYVLRYRPQKDTNLETDLYFDPQTWRHVETVYTFSSSQDIVHAAAVSTSKGPFNASAYDDKRLANGVPSQTLPGTDIEPQAGVQLPNRYRLREKFSDFKTVDGLTLPTRDDIQFSQELHDGETTVWDWDLKGLAISNNMGVDPKNFDVN
jgi:hypothetical protein